MHRYVLTNKSDMKRSIIISSVALALCLVGCRHGGNEPKAEVIANEEKTEQQIVEEPAQAEEPVQAEEPEVMAEEPLFTIVTNMGNITVKLYKETPAHRDNFVKLAKEGYYNGMLFHRIIKGFMIQTGDPNTKDPNKDFATFGTGGPGYTIPAEIVPGKTHKKGALAAARRADSVNPARESSGSQFYIVQDEEGCRHLDGEYTIFGETVEGFDVIDKIANVKTLKRDLPEEPISILSVKEVKPEK